MEGLTHFAEDDLNALSWTDMLHGLNEEMKHNEVFWVLPHQRMEKQEHPIHNAYDGFYKNFTLAISYKQLIDISKFLDFYYC